MKIQVLYLLAVNLAVVGLVALAVYSWSRRRSPGNWRGMAAVALAAALWDVMAVVMATSSFEHARLALSAKYTMLGLSSVTTFLFIARHTGHWQRTRPLAAAAFLAIPVAGHLAAWQDGAGSLRDAVFSESYGLTYFVSLGYGPLYLLTTAFHYALIFVSLGFIAQYMRRGGAIARGQGTALFMTILIPAIANVLVLVDVVPRVFDIMPLAHGLSAAALFWGVFRHQMLDLAPVGRHALVDALQDAILIVDGRRWIVDVNQKLAGMAGTTADRLLGRPLDAVLDGPLGLALGAAAALPPGDDGATSATAPLALDGRLYDVRAVPVGATAARVLVLHDITERQRWEDEQSRLIGELQGALGDVKTLTGLLPICAGCKKIRDGQGAWHQLEVYIRDRTGAEFSHGMCPACSAQWYPDLDAHEPA